MLNKNEKMSYHFGAKWIYQFDVLSDDTYDINCWFFLIHDENNNNH